MINQEYPLDRNGKKIMQGAKVRWYDPDNQFGLGHIWKVWQIKGSLIICVNMPYLLKTYNPSELEIIE